MGFFLSQIENSFMIKWLIDVPYAHHYNNGISLQTNCKRAPNIFQINGWRTIRKFQYFRDTAVPYLRHLLFFWSLIAYFLLIRIPRKFFFLFKKESRWGLCLWCPYITFYLHEEIICLFTSLIQINSHILLKILSLAILLNEGWNKMLQHQTKHLKQFTIKLIFHC